jgi:hypothetical protein
MQAAGRVKNSRESEKFNIPLIANSIQQHFQAAAHQQNQNQTEKFNRTYKALPFTQKSRNTEPTGSEEKSKRFSKRPT